MTPPDAHTIELATREPEDTAELGQAIATCCRAGDIVALDGELGAGKTQLTRGLAAGLGIDPGHVSSPTFVMVQEYDTAADPAIESTPPEHDPLILVHIDAYRLGGPDDLASIGWDGDGAAMREGAVLAIEWAQRIRPALGPDLLQIDIAYESDGRRVTLTANGGWAQRLPRLREACCAFQGGSEP